MKSKYFQTFIFLTLLILTVWSQYRTSSTVVPGWHTVVYPSNYLLVISFITLSLFLAIIGYTYFSYKKKPIGPWIFILHFLLTVPLIIALLYSFKTIDMSTLSKAEFDRIIIQKEWYEYLLFSLFIIGQLVFLIYFIKHFTIKTARK